MSQPTLKIELSTDDVFNGLILDDPVKGILDSNFLELTTANYGADITKYVRGFSTIRGTSRELQRVEAGTATILLDNRDSRFTPFNTSSPYWPNVVPMRRVRILASFTEVPETITGLTAWYDFSDLTTLFQDTARTSPITADAQIIKGITDKSGAGVHVTEATNGPTYKATIQNGRSIGRFDGSNDQLASAAAAQTTTVFTLICVFQITGGAGTTRDIFCNAGGASGYSLRATSANNRGMVFPGVVEKGDAATTANWEIWVGRHNTGSSTFYMNGGSALSLTSAATNPAAPSSAVVSLGESAGTSFFPGDMGEGLIYNRELTLAEVNQIGSYLGSKWGVSWTTAI